jgi:hypothetical protein
VGRVRERRGDAPFVIIHILPIGEEVPDTLCHILIMIHEATDEREEEDVPLCGVNGSPEEIQVAIKRLSRHMNVYHTEEMMSLTTSRSHNRPPKSIWPVSTSE